MKKAEHKKDIFGSYTINYALMHIFFFKKWQSFKCFFFVRFLFKKNSLVDFYALKK